MFDRKQGRDQSTSKLKPSLVDDAPVERGLPPVRLIIPMPKVKPPKQQVEPPKPPTK
ncbi:MAG: hypothetical protein HQK89_05565 [Nitrospirae bacterium]|nr:hypothetical protein [Nitrospirota bacterium]